MSEENVLGRDHKNNYCSVIKKSCDVFTLLLKTIKKRKNSTHTLLDHKRTQRPLPHTGNLSVTQPVVQVSSSQGHKKQSHECLGLQTAANHAAQTGRCFQLASNGDY